jgi:hypothetical protein
MSNQTVTHSVARELTQDELATVAGGQNVYSKEFPASPQRSFAPVFGPGTSIASSEINENDTDDNLPG